MAAGLRQRVVDHDCLVDVDGKDTGEGCHVLRLVQRYDDPEIAQVVLAVADGAAERLDGALDLGAAAGGGGDDQGHVPIAAGLRLDEQLTVVFAKVPVTRRSLVRSRVRAELVGAGSAERGEAGSAKWGEAGSQDADACSDSDPRGDSQHQ